MADLLFEIGTEEIPAGFLPAAMDQLGRLGTEALQAAGIWGDGASVRVHATPRRLALLATGIVGQLAEETVYEAGPPLAVAFDADGKATKAAEGFARGKGVTVDDLVRRDGRVGYERQVPARSGAEVLGEPLSELLAALPWPKTMRWGSAAERFARPIHWICAVLGGQVVEVSFGAVAAGSETRGHRFNAPDPVPVTGPEDWLSALRAASVEPDWEVRRAAILEGATALAAEAGGRLVDDPHNLRDNAFLTEWPLPAAGSFDPAYLEVPREVLVDAMRSHQRYFAVEDEAGSLLPVFIAVNNTVVRDPAVVRAGHERVLNARLADARFFWDEDRRRPLAERVADLAGVVFLAKLAKPTVEDKVARVRALAGGLSEALAADAAAVDRTALLAKADLTTLMVQEFPDLQGVMGRHYALAAGEPAEVADGIRDHYLPRGADGALPGGAVGAVVALADRLDSLAAGFSCGLKPTGSKDAYGLRRAALGILRILRERGVHIGVRDLVARAGRQLDSEVPVDELSEFILERLRHQLAAEGIPADVADAVLGAGEDDAIDAAAKGEVLAELRGRPEMEPLFKGLKRVRNIVAKAGDIEIPAVDASLFQEEGERKLHFALGQARAQLEEALGRREFARALEPLIAFKDPIDQFFEEVLVMADEPDLRRNRLALCREVSELFSELADFGRIQT